MVYESRKQPMAWMEKDYSETGTVKWRLKHLSALGVMGATASVHRWNHRMLNKRIRRRIFGSFITFLLEIKVRFVVIDLSYTSFIIYKF